ncbi:MAG: glycosyltransferase family 2 protein [Actinomycetota bacterium]|nr:glycosyltransferase family 2 protein [Actinomycetota bacterium]
MIITKDEAERIARCIESVASISEETLVVDVGSADDTVAIARRLGCRVLVNPWPGYGPQRNFGADHASHDWILWLDADEIVGEDLGRSLDAWKECPPTGVAAFRVRRIGDFMGRWLPEAADWQVRLYDRRRCRVLERLVHERVDPGQGPVEVLDGTLWHAGFRSLHDHVERFNQYTSLDACAAAQEGARFSIWRLLARPPLRFTQRYLLQRLYRHRVPGLAVALLWTYYEVLRELKLLELAGSRRDS